MLSCAEFLAEFGDYIDGVAAPELRATLEQHLHECKTCRVIVDSSRQTIRIVTDSNSFTLPAKDIETVVQQVMARVRAR
jgi:predicted anti-sigma-YlaC factor YlaD